MSGVDILHAATISPAVLVSQQMASGSDAALYTVGTTQSAKIATATLCNTTGSAVTVYFSILKNGSTIGDGTHRVISNYNLAAGDTLSLRDYVGGAMLGPGDMIAGYASTANAVDVVVTGTLHA